MKIIAVFLLWCLLLAVCWPLALLAAVMAPFVLLISLPFKLFWICLGGILALIKALVFLPARFLGART